MIPAPLNSGKSKITTHPLYVHLGKSPLQLQGQGPLQLQGQGGGGGIQSILNSFLKNALSYNVSAVIDNEHLKRTSTTTSDITDITELTEIPHDAVTLPNELIEHIVNYLIKDKSDQDVLNARIANFNLKKYIDVSQRNTSDIENNGVFELRVRKHLYYFILVLCIIERKRLHKSKSMFTKSVACTAFSSDNTELFTITTSVSREKCFENYMCKYTNTVLFASGHVASFTHILSEGLLQQVCVDETDYTNIHKIIKQHCEPDWDKLLDCAMIHNYIQARYIALQDGKNIDSIDFAQLNYLVASRTVVLQTIIKEYLGEYYNFMVGYTAVHTPYKEINDIYTLTRESLFLIVYLLTNPGGYDEMKTRISEFIKAFSENVTDANTKIIYNILGIDETNTFIRDVYTQFLNSIPQFRIISNADMVYTLNMVHIAFTHLEHLSGAIHRFSAVKFSEYEHFFLVRNSIIDLINLLDINKQLQEAQTTQMSHIQEAQTTQMSHIASRIAFNAFSSSHQIKLYKSLIASVLISGNENELATSINIERHLYTGLEYKTDTFDDIARVCIYGRPDMTARFENKVVKIKGGLLYTDVLAYLNLDRVNIKVILGNNNEVYRDIKNFYMKGFLKSQMLSPEYMLIENGIRSSGPRVSKSQILDNVAALLIKKSSDISSVQRRVEICCRKIMDHKSAVSSPLRHLEILLKNSEHFMPLFTQAKTYYDPLSEYITILQGIVSSPKVERSKAIDICQPDVTATVYDDHHYTREDEYEDEESESDGDDENANDNEENNNGEAVLAQPIPVSSPKQISKPIKNIDWFYKTIKPLLSQDMLSRVHKCRDMLLIVQSLANIEAIKELVVDLEIYKTKETQVREANILSYITQCHMMFSDKSVIMCAIKTLKDEISCCITKPSSLALAGYGVHLKQYKDLSNPDNTDDSLMKYYNSLLKLQCYFRPKHFKARVEYAVSTLYVYVDGGSKIIEGIYKKETEFKEYLDSVNKLYAELEDAKSDLAKLYTEYETVVAQTRTKTEGGGVSNKYLKITNMQNGTNALKLIYTVNRKNMVIYKGEYMIVSKYKLLLAKKRYHVMFNIVNGIV
jgi:hypothetical protein